SGGLGGERVGGASDPGDVKPAADSSMHRAPLPIDAYLDAIVDALGRSRAVLVTAATGAGKTTRAPTALLADGPVVLLQPRRVAARAIAARIAAERRWTLGG